MSIISRIRRGRQQAKDHTSSKTAENNNAALATPYHHVPNHAASDAFSTAPMDARISGQSYVREANRERRGAAGSQEQQINVPGIPHLGSSLSTASRSTSNSSRGPRGSSVAGSSMTSSNGVSYKGKEADRSPYQSRATSKGGILSSESLGDSQDKQRSKRTRVAPTIKPINIPQSNAEVGRPHRLHPSARSVSDVSVNRLAQVAKLASTPISERPRIPSTGPPLPQTPTRPIVCISTSPYSSPPYSQSLNPGGYSSFWERHSRQGSVSSLPALTPTSAKYYSSGPATPQRCTTRQSMEPAPHSPLLDFNFEFDGTFLQSGSLGMDEKNEQRRASRSRYQAKEIIDPSVGLLDFGLPRNNRHTAPSLRPGQIINTFPEPVTPPTPTPRARSWTFTKAGSKLLRKNHRRGDSKMTI